MGSRSIHDDRSSPTPLQRDPSPTPEEEDDEELECRVCREGRSQGPLLRPCRCAGSIMYAHQDCLLQWLRHSGKDACELCKHRFAFRPVYAPDAPTRGVPTAEVLARCLRKAACETLPFAARLLLAAALWLCAVPCTTSWIFRIWIRRASFLVPDLVRQRRGSVSMSVSGGAVPLGGEQEGAGGAGGGTMLWNDVVSGIIIAAFIIFSFLSLMSFADFLRFHWDVREENLGAVEEEAAMAAAAAALAAPPPVADAHAGGEEEEEEEEGEPPRANDDVDVRWQLAAEEAVEEEEGWEEEEQAPLAPPPPPALQQPAPAPGGQQARQQAQGNNLNANNENDADVELQVAVDELLGVRGPFPFLLRNILWLLAFNGAYLGLFAFIPYSVGAAVVGAAEKYADTPPLRLLLRLLVPRAMCELAVEASRAAAAEDHTLQLPDLGVILLGYLMMSAMVFTWRAVVCAVCQRAGHTLPLLWGRVVRVLEGTAAVVKVGLLLSLKMLFLPLLLGLWLDAATQPVLGPGFPERVRFATENLVGALLLHWVAGISFMLVVTVSVLQLREVLHPHILARVIRPQEPQPDLLGSLLQEPGLTHARRMALSLLIYVALLVAFVWLPARFALPTYFLKPTGENGEMGGSFRLQLRTCYLAPQLQIPLELILLHLAMLAALEHAKGGIGRVQHLWLRPLCALLGLTAYLLPLERAPLRAVAGSAGEVDWALWAPDPDDPDNYIVARRPLRRPPPAGAEEGWEEAAPPPQQPGPPPQQQGAPAEGGRNGGGGRWAWGNEPLTAAERGLAPRRRPRCLLLPRLALLLLLSWAAVLALALAAALLPLALGRAAFALLHIPPRFGHDPLAFAVGCACCWGAHKWAARLQQRVDRRALHAWVERYKASQPTLRQLGAVAAFLGVWAAASPLLLGLLFEAALAVPADRWAGVQGLHWAQDWVLGVWLLHEVVYLGYLGVLDRVWGPYHHPPAPQPGQPGEGQQGQQGQEPPATYQAAICHTLSSLQAVFLRWDWAQATAPNLLHPFTLPLFTSLLEAALLPAAVAVALPLLRAHCPGLVPFLPPAVAAADGEAGGMSDGALQLTALRMAALAWALAAASGKAREPLERWLAAVRSAAFDERYLQRMDIEPFAG